MPKPIALALAKASQKIWWPTVCPDEIERRLIDDVDTPGDWNLVNVEPDEIETFAIRYLRRFRSAYVTFIPLYISIIIIDSNFLIVTTLLVLSFYLNTVPPSL